MQTVTLYHAKYFAHDLSARRPAALVERLTASLVDAAIDLNPHQIEAALFALRSPLSKGVILADEVGLGKTIEAGLVLCQYWAEQRRRLIVICPAVLRRQWAIELQEKFNLPSVVLDGAGYAERRAAGDDPLADSDPRDSAGVIITSFQFASRHRAALSAVPWDLVVIDEAHKLRNLYRPENRMGRAIQAAFAERRKLLLTATPLQNSLLELYGLATLIDDRIFGGLDTFKATYGVGAVGGSHADLRARLKPFVQRTLRRQVLEYIRYTRREAITQPFVPSAVEQRLHDEVTDFLLRPDSYAIPWAQRQLVVLVVRKLLASSAYALIGTLKTIRQRLEQMRDSRRDETTDVQAAFAAGQDIAPEYLDAEYRETDGADEASSPIGQHETREQKTGEIDLARLEHEMAEIDGFLTLARSIRVETKAKALLTALKTGFARMKSLGAARKALIFTESSRTQRYLKEFLETHGFSGRIVTFNGQNTDPLARDILGQWQAARQTGDRATGTPSADMRQALVEFFRDSAEVMVATEAAAEGLNLQFCSLVINYDLPWNPQRIEQRIGRCHRYGQQHDVVVINFLNETNPVDQRIYELLRDKFKLFDGVFGASDEVLGRIESGIDFEQRMLTIFSTCRRPEEIAAAFAALQAELDQPIQDRVALARQTLFENFDEEVVSRLNLRMTAARQRVDIATRRFWALTKAIERETWHYNDDAMIFGLDAAFIAGGGVVRPGERVPFHFRLDNRPAAPFDPLAIRSHRRPTGKVPTGGFSYRMSDPLGVNVLMRGRELALPEASLLFRPDHHPHRISLLEERRGHSGWLWLDRLTIRAFEDIDILIFTLCDADGTPLPPDLGEKLFQVPAEIENANENENENENGFLPCPFADTAKLARAAAVERECAASTRLSERYFHEELDKLDRWAEDLKTGLELEIKQLDRDIREAGRETRQFTGLAEKLEFQKKKAALEKRRSQKRHELFTAQDQIDQRREHLIEQLEKQLQAASHDVLPLFHIAWRIVA